MERFQNIKKGFSEFSAIYRNNLETLKQKDQEIKTSQEIIKEASNSIQELNNVLLACKLILEKITYMNKTKLEQFITYALQNIFTDRNYEIELDIKEDGKLPALNILLVEDGVKQDIRDAVGGGIITTLGFLFQIYYLEVYGKNKIMLIDEGLKEVSKLDKDSEVDYLANLLNFLKWLSEERKYKFVIITHDDFVKTIADKTYKVNKGEVFLEKNLE